MVEVPVPEPGANSSDEDSPTAFWAAFGYQNHVVPVHDSRRGDGARVGVCGVMTSPAVVSECDDRPTCSVCSTAVRDGSYRVTLRPVVP